MCDPCGPRADTGGRGLATDDVLDVPIDEAARIGTARQHVARCLDTKIGDSNALRA